MGSRFSVGLNTQYSCLSDGDQADILHSENLKSFSFKLLKKATRSFHSDRVLVSGRHGLIYEGWIDERSLAATKPGTGTPIAVKRLYHLHHTDPPSDQQWLEEINYLGQINHPNLAKLTGYCLEGVHRLLVYEFMHQASLDDLLFPKICNFEPLSWNIRIKVAIGVAKGLAWLHSTRATVRCFEFKSCNILIDSNYNPKLSDFELPIKITLESSIPANGFFAPEYSRTGSWTARCEIYGFGQVLLQLLTGRKIFASKQGVLVQFVKPLLMSKEKILDIMDPNIKGQYSSIAATRAALLAEKCVKDKPENRPNADDLVEELEQIQEFYK